MYLSYRAVLISLALGSFLLIEMELAYFLDFSSEMSKSFLTGTFLKAIKGFFLEFVELTGCIFSSALS